MTSMTGTQIFKRGVSFFLDHFWGVLVAAAIPALIGIALALMSGHAQIQTMIDQLQQGVPEIKLNPFSVKFGLLLLLSWLAGLWFSVRVYRYRLSPEFPVTASEFSSVLWMAGYVLVLILLLFAIILVFVVAISLVVAMIAIAMGLKPEAGAQADPRLITLGIGVFLIVIPAYLYMIYAAFRFSIALPGVALGRRENIFHTLWPMGRGVALPLLGWFFLVGIVTLALFALLLWMTVGFSVILPSPDKYAQMLQDPSGAFRTQLIMGLVLAIPNVVFRAFGASVFAEAYAQLNREKPDAAL